MRVLTVFNYNDFKKVVNKYDAEDLVGVCQNRRGLGNGFVEVDIRASTSSKDIIIELIYYRIIESEVFLDKHKDELRKKAQELAEMLKNDGFEVVDGYWHSL